MFISIVIARLVIGMSVVTFSNGSCNIIAVRSMAINIIGIKAVKIFLLKHIYHLTQMVKAWQKHK